VAAVAKIANSIIVGQHGIYDNASVGVGIILIAAYFGDILRRNP
jgi:hypothetical protein